MAMLIALGFAGMSFAQATGHGFLQLSTNVDSLTVGNTTNIPFTYFLTNGTGGQSVIVIANSTFLSQHGINVVVINSSGTPTFNGVVELSATSAALPGSYSIPVTTGGADPAGTVDVQLNVSNPIPTTSTTIVQTNVSTGSTQQSSAPSTTVNSSSVGGSGSTIAQQSGTGTGASTGELALVAVLVVIIIVIVAIVVLRGGKKGEPAANNKAQ